MPGGVVAKLQGLFREKDDRGGHSVCPRMDVYDVVGVRFNVLGFRSLEKPLHLHPDPPDIFQLRVALQLPEILGPPWVDGNLEELRGFHSAQESMIVDQDSCHDMSVGRS